MPRICASANRETWLAWNSPHPAFPPYDQLGPLFGAALFMRPVSLLIPVRAACRNHAETADNTPDRYASCITLS